MTIEPYLVKQKKGRFNVVTKKVKVNHDFLPINLIFIDYSTRITKYYSFRRTDKTYMDIKCHHIFSIE